MPEKYLTLREAAELIGIKLRTLYNWRSRGVVTTDKRYNPSYIIQIREKWVTGNLVV